MCAFFLDTPVQQPGISILLLGHNRSVLCHALSALLELNRVVLSASERVGNDRTSLITPS